MLKIVHYKTIGLDKLITVIFTTVNDCEARWHILVFETEIKLK